MNYENNKWYWFEFNDSSPVIARFKEVSMAWTEDTFVYNEAYSLTGVANTEQAYFLLKYCKGLATPSQIGQCLKAYAEKNGYMEGVIIKDHKVKFPLIYDSDIDALYDIYRYKLYHAGKWAEIVKEDPKITLTRTEGSMSIEMDTKEKFELPSFKYKTDDFDDVDFHTLRFCIGGKDVHIYELIEVYKLALKFKDVIG